MRYDIGTIIVIVAVLLFYLRLIIIQRQRIKKARYQYSEVSKQLAKKKSTGETKPTVQYAKLGVQIRNWLLFSTGLAVMLFGAVVKFKQFTIGTFDFWWIPVLLGIILMALGVG
jgi:ABC-type Fe3+ transport system permease subunit